MSQSKDTENLEQKFNSCQKMLTVFGDNVRQRLFLLMIASDRKGVRVADIASQMKLTRPAVSHHMQILKDAGLVRCRREGKRIYYFFDTGGRSINALVDLFTQIQHMMSGNQADALNRADG